MREIKFRAWQTMHKRMLEVLAIGFENGKISEVKVKYENSIPPIITYSSASEDFPLYQENGEPYLRLMQYTGLKDRNGVDIYEGDICSTDLDRPFNIVVFRNGAFMYECQDDGETYFDIMTPIDPETNVDEYTKVIGNIYENPKKCIEYKKENNYPRCDNCGKRVTDGMIFLDDSPKGGASLCKACWEKRYPLTGIFKNCETLKDLDLDNWDIKKGKMMTINELITDAYANSVEHGWHDFDISFGDLIALAHSELSEALEEFRKGHAVEEVYYTGLDGKPEGVPVELADVIIRIADMCGKFNIDLNAALVEKMEYNKKRPYRHGNKKL